jgi:ParB family transcriptional regulator, chromosome partitioning protein
MTSTGGKRRALGRGLDALITPGTQGLREIEVERIEPNPRQPRQHFEANALQELAASIQEHGVLQPIVVAAAGDDRFRIIVGERRWQAAKLAGLARMPAVVKDVTDRQTLELALVENVQRADLNPLEEATAYARLAQDFDLTQAQIARAVGRSRVAIANTLRLLSLPPGVKAALAAERISEGHARALLPLPDEASHMQVLERIERDGLSVRQTEELVRRMVEPRSHPHTEKSPDVSALEDELRRSLGTKVSIAPSKRGGKIVIEYYSDEEFQGLYERLRS